MLARFGRTPSGTEARVEALLERFADRLDRHLAGDLARRVTPHAVGDDEEVVVFEDRVRVLVVFALEPGVRSADGGDEDEGVRAGRLLLLLDVDLDLRPTLP